MKYLGIMVLTEFPMNSAKKADLVKVGSVVTVSIRDNKRVFKIVEPSDVNPSQGHISYNAPLAQSVLGKCKGHSGSLVLPSGENITLTILKVQS